MISAPEQFKNEETYVAGGGGACPVCGSNDFGGKPVEVDGSCAWQNVSCLDCGAEITDLYQLSGVDVNWSEARSCRYLSIKVLLEVDEDISSVGEQALQGFGGIGADVAKVSFEGVDDEGRGTGTLIYSGYFQPSVCSDKDTLRAAAERVVEGIEHSLIAEASLIGVACENPLQG